MARQYWELDIATYLVRYGAVPEVARFAVDDATLARGDAVVVETHRGLQMGTVLEAVATTGEVEDKIVRVATDADRAAGEARAGESEEDFVRFAELIEDSKIGVELIDAERTLDGAKRILYVLCDRGPETTRLALQAAASGLGIVEVQPVTAAGLASAAPTGGCGSGGCGCNN